MITSYEVGAVFRIIDGASPALKTILNQVRELSKSIEGARANLAEIAKPAAMGTAITATGDLAKAWGDVAKNAEAAKLAIGNASMASARASLPGAARAATGGGGFRGGGGPHITGPGVSTPGGHISFRGPAAAAVGFVGYGAYQAAKFDDAAILMASHAHVDLAANRDKFRHMLEDASVSTGYGESEVSAAAQQYLRMMQHTGGDGGVSELPLMMRLAATEARRKGTSLEEAMQSLTGLSHMLRKYGATDIAKLAPAFTVLSTSDPRHLSQIERAAGYSVPILSTGLGFDPYETLAFSTVLARAGVTNSKSGTWLANMFTGALPGTSQASKTRFKMHEAALAAFGLVDDKGNVTWKGADGQLDPMKFLEIARAHWAAMSPEDRTKYGQGAFGKQGARAFAVLADPVIGAQTDSIIAAMNSPDQLTDVRNFMADYGAESSVQAARTAMAQFNVTMAELGNTILPGANLALHDFQWVLAGVRKLLPGGQTEYPVARAIEGGVIGGVVGGAVGLATAGPAGIVPGAIVGGLRGAAGGGVLGTAEQFMASMSKDSVEKAAEALGTAAAKVFDAHMRTVAGPGGGFKPAQILPPLHINLNIDGRTVADAVSDHLTNASAYPTDPPASNGAETYGP